jgi:iron complex transport system substrate-binding protein
MGLGESLVGLTRFCVHPAGVAEGRVKVGGTKEIDLARLEALEPDLVLANVEENSQEIAAQLDGLGQETWWAFPRTVAEALEDLEALGLLLGVDLDASLERLRGALSPPEGSFRFAYLIWREPWMAVGEETFIASMLATAGGTCAFAGRYPEVTLDQLRGVEVLLSSEPFPFSDRHVDELIAAGLAPERIHRVDGELCSWHGLRMEEGLAYLRQLAERLAAQSMRTTV